MTLRDHLTQVKKSVAEFADDLGEPRNTIRKIAYRQRQPSIELAARIIKATDGAVTLDALVLPPSERPTPPEGLAV